MNAAVPLVDRLLVEALQAEAEWLRADHHRLTLSRRRWRRFTWALIAVWGTLVVLSLLAGPSPSPCLRGRLQPAYSLPIHPGRARRALAGPRLVAANPRSQP